MSEDFFFHMAKHELIAMNCCYGGDLAGHIRRILDSRKPEPLVALFRTIVLKAYTKRSEDGPYWVKSQALQDEFAFSKAFPQLIADLSHSKLAATRFVEGMVNEELFPLT